MYLTELEKQIYNSYLAASRTSKSKPYTPRRDFTKIDDKIFVILKKLSSLFENNKNVGINDYFTATFSQNNAEYIDIQFFITPKAIKNYTLYKRKQETSSPDSEESINLCKKCCNFITRYCIENNLTLNEYKSQYKGTTPIILQHLRDHSINFNIIHGLECSNIIKQVEPDLLEFFIADFNNLLNNTRINFIQSKKLKLKIRDALKIIEEFLLKKKTNIII